MHHVAWAYRTGAGGWGARCLRRRRDSRRGAPNAATVRGRDPSPWEMVACMTARAAQRQRSRRGLQCGSHGSGCEGGGEGHGEGRVVARTAVQQWLRARSPLRRYAKAAAAAPAFAALSVGLPVSYQRMSCAAAERGTQVDRLCGDCLLASALTMYRVAAAGRAAATRCAVAGRTTAQRRCAV
jgi:hypothetical protein